MPLFSIIVPIYNIEREYLEAALDSVTSQTNASWECLCVDDGSTNDVGSVLDAFARKDNRFSIFHRKNSGVGAARNFALAQAKGKWIVFLDGDDILSPNALDTLSSLISAHQDTNIIRYGFQKFTNGTTFDSNRTQTCRDVDLAMQIPKSLAEVFAWEFAFRHDIATCIKFSDLLIGEDTLFVLECLKRSGKYLAIPTVLYGYRHRPNSVMQSTMTCQKLLAWFTSSIKRLELFADCQQPNHMYDDHNLIRFIIHDYITHVCHNIAARERNPLWDAWFAALPFLSSRHELNAVYRAICIACNMTRSRFISYLLCGVFLSAAWRLHLPFATAMNPSIR